MNRQRKVLITTTYNELGIIIDTKAEEVAQPDLQPTCNQLATDCISRQQAIDAINALHEKPNAWLDSAVDAVMTLPSAQSKRKKGKWEVFYPNHKYKYHCSECGAYHRAMYDFCPSCGAYMGS